MNYYYLVTSLEDVSLETEKINMRSQELIELFPSELSKKDWELFKAFLYQFDNKNLIACLEKKEDFDPRGNFSKEALEEEIKTPLALPKYMIEFLENLKRDQREFPHLSLENELTIFYFDYLQSFSSPFIKRYISFEYNLRNVLAALNSKKFEKDIERNILMLKGEESELLIQNSSSDFGLSRHYPWLSEIIQAYQDLDVLDLEKKLCEIRLQEIEDILKFDYFSIDRLLGHWWKLSIVERYIDLTPEKGEENFSHIVDELASEEHVLKNFEEEK